MASAVAGSSKKGTHDECDDKDSFRNWLSERLQYYNADDEVFLPYILSILEEADINLQNDDEGLDSLSDILDGLGIDSDCCKDNSINLKKEIWTKWNKAMSLENAGGVTINGHAAIRGANEKVDIQTQLARITESRSEAYKASAKAAAERQNESEEKDRKAVKAAILAQYQDVDEESEPDEEESDKCKENDLTMMKNENKDAVAKAEQEKREKCRTAAVAKKEKDKEDRDKQKKEQEDRKKKAQEKASKGERRR